MSELFPVETEEEAAQYAEEMKLGDGEQSGEMSQTEAEEPAAESAAEEPVEAEQATEEEPEQKQDDKGDEKAGEEGESDFLAGASEEFKRHERGLRKQVSQLREEMKAEREENERRLKVVLDKQIETIREATRQPDPPPPDQYEDPDGYQQHLQAENQRLQEDVQTREQQEKANTEFQGQIDGAKQQYLADSQNYGPKYQEMEQFTINAYTEEVRRMMPRASDADIAQKVQADIGAVIFDAHTKGFDIARVVESHALRYGYKQPEPSNGAGDTQAPTQAEKTAETIVKGQKAAKSTSKSGGGSDDELTWESLSRIKDGKKFDTAYDRLIEKERGGPQHGEM
jgi:hypothetical protein